MYNLNILYYQKKDIENIWWKNMELDKNKKIIIIILIAILIILVSISAFSLMQKNAQTLQINDINIEKDAFGIYKLVGHITPEKDYDYLEARIVFYDKDNTVIGKSACAWNIVDAKQGEKLSLGDSLGAVCDGVPAYAIVEFYDSVYSDTPLTNATITFNGNNTNSTNNGTTSTVAGDTDNDKKYTDEDLDNARNDGYSEGYDDASYDYDEEYYEYADPYENFESSSSGSSSSDGGSSDSGSSYDVETTTN